MFICLKTALHAEICIISLFSYFMLIFSILKERTRLWITDTSVPKSWRLAFPTILSTMEPVDSETRTDFLLKQIYAQEKFWSPKLPSTMKRKKKGGGWHYNLWRKVRVLRHNYFQTLFFSLQKTIRNEKDHLTTKEEKKILLRATITGRLKCILPPPPSPLLPPVLYSQEIYKI